MIYKNLVAALLVVFSVIAGASVAKASFVYTYSGTALTAGAGTFVGSSISGEFTLASALGDNFTGTLNPTQFSFSDSNFGFLFGNSDSSFYSFSVQTNSTGAIISWAISIYASSGPWSGGIQTSSSGDSISSLGPTTLISGSNSGAPGTWSVSDPPAVPLPSALPLFVSGLGLVGVFWLRRERRRTSAA